MKKFDWGEFVFCAVLYTVAILAFDRALGIGFEKAAWLATGVAFAARSMARPK